MRKRLLDFWYGWIVAPIWQMKRRIVLLRDKGHCKYCYEILSAKTFTIDHVVPLSGGGTDAFENLVACCKYCNKFKGSLPLTPEMKNEMWMMAYRRHLHNGDRHRRSLPNEVRNL
jgi:5-methylcytosine-specific restriction endonuclease McrA